MEPIPELLSELYRERVLRARRMSPDHKVRLGFEMFEQGCQWMADQVRRHFPEATEEQVRGIVRHVLRRMRP
jgi:hypothetical protein